jgi:predicted ATP-grasp superfamily ATP-dependent carboligase
MTEKGVIIIGGNVQGLGLLRTYARNNIQTIVINNKQLDIVKFSKFLKRYIFFRDVGKPQKLKDFLITLAETEDLQDWVILPTEDSVVYTLSRYKSELEQFYKIPTAGWDVVKVTYDKKLTYLLAEKLGIPIPKTFYPKNFEDVQSISRTVEYPCLLKPAVMHRFYNQTGKKLLTVNTREELLSSYQTMARLIPPSEILIQEIVTGTPKHPISFGCFMTKDSVSWIMIEKKRMIPLDFGVGTYNETVMIPELKDLSLKILNELGYTGLCEVEFIKDSKDQRYKFLEINPRSWLQITITNQSNKPLIPLVYYYHQNKTEMVYNITKTNNDEFHKIKWVHFWQDIYVVVTQTLRGTIHLSEYLKTFRGKVEYAVESWDDPLPFLIEPWLYCVSFVKKIIKKRSLLKDASVEAELN